MPMEFGYPPHESCNIPSRTKIHSEKRFVFLGKPPFHPCLYMNGRAFEMVFLFAAHQIFRLAVISDTGNEWIDPAGSWFCRMDHTPILFQKNTGVVNTCNFQHEHEIPSRASSVYRAIKSSMQMIPLSFSRSSRVSRNTSGLSKGTLCRTWRQHSPQQVQ